MDPTPPSAPRCMSGSPAPGSNPEPKAGINVRPGPFLHSQQTEPAIVPPHKALPYTPTRVKTGPHAGRLRSTQVLNPTTLDPSEAPEGSDSAAVCGSFAIAHATQDKVVDQWQTEDDVRAFFSSGGLRENFALLREWQAGPEETKQTVSDRGFGLWLEDLAMGMQAQGLAVAGGVLFLFGPNHALSVRVHRKVENGKESFRLTGHDANSDHCGTGNHKAMEAATPQDFRPMSLGQFFERFTTHYQGLTSGIPTVTIICPMVRLRPPQDLAYAQLPHGTARRELGEAIAGAIAFHLPNVLRTLCLKLKAGGATLEEGVELLEALNKNRTSALLFSAACGRSGFLASFAENALEIMEIEGPGAQKLLEARSQSTGHTTLTVSARLGHPGVFDDMARALGIAGVSGKDAVPTYKKNARGGESPLTEAAKRGHLGAFLDMAKATNTARMEDGDARDLLLALTTRGTSALGVAVIQRRSGAFIAFAQALVERGIVDGPALQMLDHRGVLRMTPIEMAPRVGYPDAKAEYARAKQLVEAGPAQP